MKQFLFLLFALTMLVACQQDETLTTDSNLELNTRSQECNDVLVTLTALGENCIACPGGNETKGTLVELRPSLSLSVPASLEIYDASPNSRGCSFNVDFGLSREPQVVCVPAAGFFVRDRFGPRDNCQFVELNQ